MSLPHSKTTNTPPESRWITFSLETSSSASSTSTAANHQRKHLDPLASDPQHLQLSLENGNLQNAVPDCAVPEFPRAHNSPQEIARLLSGLGVKKRNTPWTKTAALSVMAGFWVCLAGILATSMAGGVPADLRKSFPVIPRFLAAAMFPVGIIFEVLFGGELFTGNNMILAVSYLDGRVRVRSVLYNWTLVWIGNLIGSLLTLALFAYLPELFLEEPYRSFVIAGAEVRANLPWWNVFLRSIPANVLVCLSVYLGLMGRDLAGKMLGMYLPVFVFVATSMEHCIADMYFIPMGMALGANVSISTFIFFSVASTAGNIFGGAVLAGGSLWYMYAEHGQPKREKVEEKVKEVKEETTVGEKGLVQIDITEM